MFRTIQHSPHWTNLSDFVFRATAHCAGLTGKAGEKVASPQSIQEAEARINTDQLGI